MFRVPEWPLEDPSRPKGSKLIQLAMGRKPVTPVNIPIFTNISSKTGGAPTPKWDPIGFEPQPVDLRGVALHEKMTDAWKWQASGDRSNGETP